MRRPTYTLMILISSLLRNGRTALNAILGTRGDDVLENRHPC